MGDTFEEKAYPTKYAGVPLKDMPKDGYPGPNTPVTGKD